jgi:hypothetical protein
VDRNDQEEETIHKEASSTTEKAVTMQTAQTLAGALVRDLTQQTPVSPYNITVAGRY